jgi:hypothetical protein
MCSFMMHPSSLVAVGIFGRLFTHS